MQTFGASGVNILTNANEVSGQTVPHYHVHVLPRYNEHELKFAPLENNLDIELVYQEFLKSN